MLTIFDLILELLDWAVTSIGVRRACWATLVIGVALGVPALVVFDAPGWAAVAFASAAIDMWTLARGHFSDEEDKPKSHG